MIDADTLRLKIINDLHLDDRTADALAAFIEEQCSESYQDGYNSGYDQGYANGYGSGAGW
jgi:hypothetical protein